MWTYSHISVPFVQTAKFGRVLLSSSTHLCSTWTAFAIDGGGEYVFQRYDMSGNHVFHVVAICRFLNDSTCPACKELSGYICGDKVPHIEIQTHSLTTTFGAMLFNRQQRWVSHTKPHAWEPTLVTCFLRWRLRLKMVTTRYSDHIRTTMKTCLWYAAMVNVKVVRLTILQPYHPDSKFCKIYHIDYYPWQRLASSVWIL